MPRISVIVPARNAVGTITAAITSTLRALPADAEVVIVDDGSTDGTGSAVEAIDDRRVVLRRHEQSQGVAASLNELLEATDSEYIARMDADDLVLPWRFRLQRAALGEADVVFNSVVEFGDGMRVPRPSTPLHVPPRAFAVGLLFGNFVAHSTAFARRSAFEAVAGYRVCAAEDYDLWMRLAAAGSRLVRLRTPVLGYRVHEAQVSNSDEWRLRATDEPQVRESYAALAAHVLGTGPDAPEAFTTRLRAAVETERGLTRRYLRRRLANSPVPAQMARPSSTASTSTANQPRRESA